MRLLSFLTGTCTALCAAAFVLFSGTAQQRPASHDATSLTPSLIQSVKGPDLFRAYCASCHGADARTPGPVAAILTQPVPDLTLLQRRHGDRFPAALVQETILGDKVIQAHGTREMPIWGPVFHQVEGDTDWGNVRVQNLVTYLQSIQR